MAKAQPKLGWLEQAREQINDSSEYRKLGSTDIKLGLAIGDERRLVTFEAFEIANVESIDEDDVRDAELLLTMTAKDWNAYLRQRKAGKGPSLMSLDLDERVMSAKDPLAKLKFERYNRSLQAFIDVGASLSA